MNGADAMGEKEKRYLTLPEVKDLILTEAEERVLTYEQTQTLGHAEKFSVLTVEDSIKLVSDLMENFEFMTPKLAYKTADILPMDVNGIRAVFARDRYTPSEEDCDKITATIKKYM